MRFYNELQWLFVQGRALLESWPYTFNLTLMYVLQIF